MYSNSLKFFTICLVFLAIIFVNVKISAKGDKKNHRIIYKTNDSQLASTYLDINNLSALQSNQGYSDYNQNPNLEGTEFPKGSGKTAVFESGFLWGGYVGNDPQVRVGGSAYISGIQPGPIDITGNPANPDDPKYGIYRVRPDVYPGGPSVDLTNDASIEGISADQIRAQYESDWNNWPAAGTSNDLGAPFTDKNGDGKYEPGIDVPGVPGADQTIYFVANDMNGDRTTKMYGAQPLGLEIHATYWAYAQQGPLGNMYFKRYTLINKGAQHNLIDSMFVSWWADIDLGDGNDDLVGCDTTLSLQYCYNSQSSDAVYTPLPPPSDGADFFQGPLVDGTPSDSGIFNGRIIHGKKNLPMTAAYFFVNSDANFGDPPQGTADGSTQFYRFFNGEYGISGQPFIDNVGNTTKFAFYGDPVTHTGWLDGVSLAPGDRRLGMASGPFNMAPGDTQEVTVAEIFAGAIPGVDYLSAISLLKYYDQTAQAAFNNFFQLPSPPPPPKLNTVALDQKITLNWGEDENAVKATEKNASKGYSFEGYNVYQLPNQGATVDEGKRLATFDIVDGVLKISDQYFDANSGEVGEKVVEFGTDSGIKRTFTVATDIFSGNRPLVNGTPYFFAVTSYSYNQNSIPHALENPVAIVTVIPQSSNSGTRYTYASGDTIKSVHLAGKSDGNVIGLVVNPNKLTGDAYKVTFDSSGGTLKWSLTDVTKNQVVLQNQSNQSGDDNYIIVDGIQFKVLGPQPAIKSNASNEAAGMVEVRYANKLLTSSEYDAAGSEFNGNAVWHSLNSDQQEQYYVSAGGGSGSLDRLTRSIADAVPYDFAIKFTDTTSANPDYAVWGYDEGEIGKVPFQLWRYDPFTGDSVRLIPVLYSGGDGTPGYFKVKGVDPAIGYNSTDWIYWYYDPQGYDAFAAACAGGDVNTANSFGVTEYFSRMIFADYDGDGKIAPPGTEIKIITTKPNQVSDEFMLTAIAPTSKVADIKEDVNKINVFPNPYYGVNPLETNKYAKFVTFNHLPAKATIRIFNLAGTLVKTIDHNAGSANQQFDTWDLTNSSGLSVASGLYIVYIDMPDIGASKILKVAIVQEQQYLDRF